jgi:hypothetical protein
VASFQFPVQRLRVARSEEGALDPLDDWQLASSQLEAGNWQLETDVSG